jgi:hypothetical protein
MEKERENKKYHKKRLLLLLIALFFTTVMFTTTTYAWFTANQTVTVSTLTVNVDAKNGIQISSDATNWKSILQTEDLTTNVNAAYSGNLNQIPNTMEPVSTIGNLDSDGHMDMFYGVIQDNAAGQYIITATKETDTKSNGATSTGKYIAFDMFLKVNKETRIALTSKSGVRTTDPTDTGIKNASRIAFIVEGNATEETALATIQGLKTTDTENVYIWEPNYDVHTAAGVAQARDVYNTTTTMTGGSLLAYSGVKAPIADSNNVVMNVSADETAYGTNPGATSYTTAYGSLFGTVAVDYSTVEAFSATGSTATQEIFTLAPGVTKVRVYMWIEGQDVDCENNASGGEITYDIQITTVETP